MLEWLLANELGFRLVCFFAVLLVVLQAEQLWPRRLDSGGWQRKLNNLLLVVVNTLAVRFVVPMAAVGVAALTASQGWGLFNWLLLSPLPVFLLSILLLDLAVYAQHVFSHWVPLIWRLHRVHHSDIVYDVTTGLRFHPIEIILSMVYKMIVVVLIGAPVVSVLIFEVVLNASAMFNHGNIALPTAVDRRLRKLIVTPDMHRVHHSVYRQETDSNYGFFLSIWDRLFNTYRSQPKDGHESMTIGLRIFREKGIQNLLGMLLQPFMKTDPASDENSTDTNR